MSVSATVFLVTSKLATVIPPSPVTVKVVAPPCTLRYCAVWVPLIPANAQLVTVEGL